MTALPGAVILQAASRSYGGGPDMCLNLVQGRPVAAWAMDKAAATFPGAPLRLAAPAFDAGGVLDTLMRARGGRSVTAHDASPLARLVAVTADLPDEAVVVRLDGLHFGFFAPLARLLVATALAGGYDLVKAPDDYPIQLTVDVYRVGALRRLAGLAGLEPAFHIHPKYAMLLRPKEFSCLRLAEPPWPDDAALRALRRFAAAVYDQDRLEARGPGIAAGDQWRFHYELAEPYMRPGWAVLDAACGAGYGTARLAGRVRLAVGVDRSGEALTALRAAAPGVPAVRADVTRLPLAGACLDAVVGFETLEHVAAGAYLSEVARVLRPGGLFVLSTPQNSLGHIPINARHAREYSLRELAALLEGPFVVERLIGIKQGRIVFEGDPLGQNTVAVCRKPQTGKRP